MVEGVVITIFKGEMGLERAADESAALELHPGPPRGPTGMNPRLSGFIWGPGSRSHGR